MAFYEFLAGFLATSFFTLFFGNVLSNFPQKRSGENSGGGLTTAVIGYDTLRGEFSTLSAVIISACGVGLLAVYSGWPLALGISFFLYIRHVMSKPVSFPGNARTVPAAQQAVIKRKPRWDGQDHKWPDAFSWSCCVGAESHRLTEAACVERPLNLTGVAAGRQIWHRLSQEDTGLPSTIPSHLRPHVHPDLTFNPATNPNTSDKVFRAQQIRRWLRGGGSAPTPETPASASEAARKGLEYYRMLQCEDGHFAGDYGGPHFLLPGLVVVWYVTGRLESFLALAQRKAMTYYLCSHQQKDGGWGTHIESPSTMFGTVMSYVALRLLGVLDPQAPEMKRGRAFIKQNRGAVYTASWAKFYLCVLGVMDWDGHNSVPAEMFLLPNWFPFHPGRLWCHCRMVYLPMSYLYGQRFVYADTLTDPVTVGLRSELYVEAYDSIDWTSTRHLVAPMDNYSPIPTVMRVLQDILVYWERWGGPVRRALRTKALDFAAEYIYAEDQQTNFIDIGPVNKVLNMLTVFHRDGADSECFRKHLLRVPDYLWVAEDGMKMQGYNGSQCWDSSFLIQAVHEAGLINDFPALSKGVWRFLEQTQILSTATARASPAFGFEDVPNRLKFYRHVSEGGWPFSTSAHGWPISDCTAEGLKGVLSLLDAACITDDAGLVTIGGERLEKAVNVILTLQNTDGGWATYENNRGYGWYESLNPSEVFGDIMIDYSYVECSCASMGALIKFQRFFPKHRAAEIKAAIDRGLRFIKKIQRDDGSWYGSWGCCFTYGTWFGIEGLVLAGESTDSPAINKAVAFLEKHQRLNGGWGEDFSSCYNKDISAHGMKDYGDDQGSGVVPTAWALLALLAAGRGNSESVRRGVAHLMAAQDEAGDWPQQGILGVFNRACGITYTAYRNIFPIWALGRFAKLQRDGFERPRGAPTEAATSSPKSVASSPRDDVQPRNSQREIFQTDTNNDNKDSSHASCGAKCLCLALGIACAVWAMKNQEQSLSDPTGLFIGLSSVVLCQMLVLTYYLVLKAGALRRLGLEISPVQPDAKPRDQTLTKAVLTHLSQPEGFLLLGGYLSLTWMLKLLPDSYYHMDGNVQWPYVLLQLLLVDFFMFVSHRLEHLIPFAKHIVYRASHKPHHVFTAPRLTDAFDGSLVDTTCMILVPLYLTALLVPCNAWSYIVFGTIYGNYLCIIHCEYNQPWDPIFRALGIGTPGDHHVHHTTFKYNYGHLFTYWDRIFGTYRNPMDVRQLHCSFAMGLLSKGLGLGFGMACLAAFSVDPLGLRQGGDTVTVGAMFFQGLQYVGAPLCAFIVYWSLSFLPVQPKAVQMLLGTTASGANKDAKLQVEKKQGAYGKVTIFQPKISLMGLLKNPRALRAVARLKLFGGLPGVKKGLMPRPPGFEANKHSKEDILFCGKILDKVSRSFAAVIRQLPVSLVLPVTLFYLALRALDTIEDDMDMSKFERCLASLRRMDNDRACPATTRTSHSSPDLDSLSRAPRPLTAAGPKHAVFRNMKAVTLKHRVLCRFYRLMLNEHERKADDATRPPSLADAQNAQLDTMLAQVLYTSDVGEADEHTLLVNFEQCIRVFRSCPAPQREIIADITRRMGEGMAEYILRDLGKIGTRDLADYNRYCHFVAGLVGEGLSRLFAANTHDSGDLSAETRRILLDERDLGSLSSDMGLFLQKTNIIRDYLEDLVDMRAFWPKEVWGRYVGNGDRATAGQPGPGTLGDLRKPECRRDAVACLNHLITDALSLVPSCLEYLKRLEAGSDRVLRFCAIPQAMAIATMAELYGNPRVFEGVVKIGKPTAACIVLDCDTLEGVYRWFEDGVARIRKVANDESSPYYNAVISLQTNQALTNIDVAIKQKRAAVL